jgi:hypothetical protein
MGGVFDFWKECFGFSRAHLQGVQVWSLDERTMDFLLLVGRYTNIKSFFNSNAQFISLMRCGPPPGYLVASQEDNSNNSRRPIGKPKIVKNALHSTPFPVHTMQFFKVNSKSCAMSRSRCFIHMTSLREDRAESLVHLCLERRKRHTLSINGNIAIVLVFRDDAVAENLAVPYARHVEEVAVLDSKQHLHGCQAANVTIDADKVHESVIG